MNAARLSLLAVGLAVLTLPAFAFDWPQWRGPDRTDVSKETGLLKSWPKEGPKLVWTFKDAGGGYSGPSIVGDRLYCVGGDDKREFVFAVDVKTGEKLWATDFSTGFRESHGSGPRGNPTVDGEFVYALGGGGKLACFKVEKGELVWSKDLLKDLGGVPPANNWGFSESVLIDGDQLICMPGGQNGAVAALNKKTGEVIWRTKGVTDAPSFSSAIIAEIAGVKQYVVMVSRGVVGVAPKDGKVLWHYTEGQYKNVIPTPVYHDGHVYITRGYGVGCDLIKLTANGDGTFKSEKVYSNNTNMVNHHGGVVLIGNEVYGYSDGKGWVCQDFKTGEIKWSDRGISKGCLTCADGMLYCYDEANGVVALIEANTGGWKEAGKFNLPEASKMHGRGVKYWTHPVVCNGKMYVRDQDLLFCFDVKAK